MLGQSLAQRQIENMPDPHDEILNEYLHPQEGYHIDDASSHEERAAANYLTAISKTDGLNILYDKHSLPQGTQALQPWLEAFQAHLGLTGLAYLQQAPIFAVV